MTAPELACAAFALDSVLLQLIIYAAGLPIVAVIATSASPPTEVVTVAALTIVGNLAVTLLTGAVHAAPPSLRPGHKDPTRLAGLSDHSAGRPTSMNNPVDALIPLEALDSVGLERFGVGMSGSDRLGDPRLGGGEPLGGVRVEVDAVAGAG